MRCRGCIPGVLATFLVVAACAAPDPLPPKSAAVPAGVDLTGLWTLREDSLNTNERIADAERRAAGAGESLIPKGSQNRSRRTSDDSQVHVFLESGESLKLTQTEHGLFVSFDRAVVEEYRFGEQRTVNVGPIAADRVSGWEDGAYAIETRDKEGDMLFETYRLDSADTMIRTVRIVDDGETTLNVRQVFDRS
ncbi:MAG: hypothetical protein P8X81_06940 [Woeseiaceae bacterium]|jgi:hypothetical protein